MDAKKLILLLVSFMFIFSFALGLITLSLKPNPSSSNEFEFSELFDEPFHTFPVQLISYSDSENYIDSVLSSSDIKVNSGDVIGLFRYEKENIILIKSNESITEIIANDDVSIQKINVLELNPVSSKEFSSNGNLMERTVIDLSELKIPLINSSDSLVVSVLEVSHESWENKIVCTDGKSNYMRIGGMYFIDGSNDVIVTGTSSEVLSNCILLSVIESNDNLQNNGVLAAFSNEAKWESRGLLVTSKSTRESQILVDRYLNIETWVTGDSWFGIG
jgi:hypothetical protein